MARGSASKEIITAKLLSIFEGSFINGKEIRVPMTEDGALIEIKITLTAAKDIIGGNVPIEPSWGQTSDPTPMPAEPTEEEKENVATLLKSMGF